MYLFMIYDRPTDQETIAIERELVMCAQIPGGGRSPLHGGPPWEVPKSGGWEWGGESESSLWFHRRNGDRVSRFPMG